MINDSLPTQSSPSVHSQLTEMGHLSGEKLVDSFSLESGLGAESATTSPDLSGQTFCSHESCLLYPDSLLASTEQPLSENELLEQYNTELEIRKILNQQTIVQFTLHAEETFPKDLEKQEELVAKLQEQYFHQYMTEVHANQLAMQKEQFKQIVESAKASNSEFDADSYEVPPLIPASLWTRKDIVEFKKEILRDSKECCIKIRSLETATIRVPTCSMGKNMFWEFATDSYDLGFGLYFEWCLNPSDKVTVHISESSDEEEEDGDYPVDGSPADDNQFAEETAGSSLNRDVECRIVGHDSAGGGSQRGLAGDERPITDELIPIYRRDCHLDVFCGSHRYPGQGYYILKFDNSFSLWRSKWLYYRVFYTS